MSRIVATKLGRFRSVTDGGKQSWLWECPNCKTWGRLSPDQLEGRVSVYCEVLVHSPYDLTPDAKKPCGYHKAQEYAKELATTIQARELFGIDPYEPALTTNSEGK